MEMSPNRRQKASLIQSRDEFVVIGDHIMQGGEITSRHDIHNPVHSKADLTKKGRGMISTTEHPLLWSEENAASGSKVVY